jgi:hypothetical protein
VGGAFLVGSQRVNEIMLVVLGRWMDMAGHFGKRSVRSMFLVKKEGKRLNHAKVCSLHVPCEGRGREIKPRMQASLLFLSFLMIVSF